MVGGTVAAFLATFSNPRLGAVATFLATPAGATIAWVHFLCFDAFVGRWVYLDAHRRGISPLLVAPVLLLVLFAGPFGFLIHLVVRAVRPVRGVGSEPVEGTAVL